MPRPPRRPLVLPCAVLLLIGCALALRAEEAPKRLRVSENRRFLCREDGSPFFYLGDTAWELFHRLTREDASLYLEERARQGFTVVQAVLLAEEDGLHLPNAYGETPLLDDDPARPNEKYFAHVDGVVEKAASLGLTFGLLPTWGDKWNKKWGVGPEIFNPTNAEAYGEWLGRRYKEMPIIWILGGDRPVETERHREILQAMARGLRRGDEGRHLISLHPSGGQGSAQWFHDADWLDFNMRQNGHGIEWDGRYENTHGDYDRTPVKPVLDAEPVYEDHPVDFKGDKLGYTVAADVRRALYWDLFGGACGHTYGDHSIWQFYDPAGRKPVNNPLLPWQQALVQPGAQQMQHARHLLASRPYFSRLPDDTLILPDPVPLGIPGHGTRRFVATRDAGGSYALIYAPVGRPFRVRTEALSGATLRAWWFNPRDGSSRLIGESPRQNEASFTPPDLGESVDWVLVLDDASQNYPTPGVMEGH